MSFACVVALLCLVVLLCCVWGGDAEILDFYYDLDGDGFGAGNAVYLCDAYVATIMVDNNDDSDDDCYSNIHDCLGVCDGISVVDECGVCDGDNSSCSDCAGTPNGDAVEDNCGTCDADSSNDCLQDCTGVWGGSAVYETNYQDTDGDGLGFVFRVCCSCYFVVC